MTNFNLVRRVAHRHNLIVMAAPVKWYARCGLTIDARPAHDDPQKLSVDFMKSMLAEWNSGDVEENTAGGGKNIWLTADIEAAFIRAESRAGGERFEIIEPSLVIDAPKPDMGRHTSILDGFREARGWEGW